MANIARAQHHGAATGPEDRVEHLLRHAGSVWLITPERELVTGAPEELGLGGHLRRMLGDTAAFDPRTGTFTWDDGQAATARVTAPHDCPADLLAWTVRAVQRAGYRVGEQEAEVTVEVRASGGWRSRSAPARFGAGAGRLPARRRLTEGGAISGRRRWPSSPAGWWTRPRAPRAP
ncbi:hypothetical protein ACIBI7_48465 [Nonomuraea fuscirosea]|uniref:hypothetical protein n=1 Tax=Nonomuraea fuscirosea TaxID=1291556 RepID=UPI00378AD273